MAGPGSAQERLDHITRIIAANMVAEVCSVYVARRGDVLELYSTEGLSAEAVHKTRLRFGEGLIGTIAASAQVLNLTDAQAHRKFVYRPETHEEAYHSFLGVPILHGGRVIGVLAVQNRTERHYAQEEEEALQTIAMVMAEMVSSGDLIDPDDLNDGASVRRRHQRRQGMPLSEGMAFGTVVLHEPRVHVDKLVAEDPVEERRRLNLGIQELRATIDDMLASSAMAFDGEHREVLEAYKMFAHDAGWGRRLEEAVDSGLTAEAAVERIQSEDHSRMDRVDDPYLRDRLHDLEDLAHRLLRHLAGRAGTAAHDNLPDDAIVVARAMGPAELLDYDRNKLRGVALEEGAPTSHVAIVARALDLPMVGRVDDLLERADEGDKLVVDGDTGQVIIQPDDDVVAAYGESMKLRAAKQAEYAALKEEKAVTRDGVEISLQMNAGLLVDLPHLDETGADGIGLFRTELQFMVSATLPRLQVQADLYSAVLDAAGPRPVIFRTLDIGSDKVVPYIRRSKEENPALGWRAVRLALDRPALLRYQIRAMLIAASGRQLSFMFPMVSDVAEFLAARAMLDKELERCQRLGLSVPADIRVGAMLEVPSLAWQLKLLLPHVDFISIGSNDLIQFLYAWDRNNPRIANRYEVLSPTVLSFLGDVINKCNKADVPVSLCGEMSGRPLEAMALIGLGLRSLSMSAAALGPVKMMIRSLDYEELAHFLPSVLGSADRSVRETIRDFAAERGVII
jgi:phosphotransferase system, enzyme I, PtsP